MVVASAGHAATGNGHAAVTPPSATKSTRKGAAEPVPTSTLSERAPSSGKGCGATTPLVARGLLDDGLRPHSRAEGPFF